MRPSAARLPFASAILFVVTSCSGSLAPRAESAASHPPLAEPPIPLTTIVRDGDPEPAIALAVVTAGAGGATDSEVAVALLGVVESRLNAAHLATVTAAARDGYRVRLRLSAGGDPRAAARELVRALSLPVRADEAAVIASARTKLQALSTLPSEDPSFASMAECEGALSAPRPDAHARNSVSATELESWRQAAHVPGRVAFAAVGPELFTDAVRGGLAAWGEMRAPPPVPLLRPTAPAPSEDGLSVYPLEERRGARITTMVMTSRAEAEAVARALGGHDGALAARLETDPRHPLLREVKVTFHPFGTCLAATVEMRAERETPSLTAVAEVTALVMEELESALGGATGAPEEPTLAPADSEIAAEQAAWAHATHGVEESRRTGSSLRVAVGLGTEAHGAPNGPEEAVRNHFAAELDRARLHTSAQAVEARTAVERGQGELFVVVGSPCGVDGEDARTGGVTAAFALAAAHQAEARNRREVHVSPWTTPLGAGLVAHAARQPGESALSHARRVADVAGRAWLTSSVEASFVREARTTIVEASRSGDGLLRGATASALAHEAPSLFAPFGIAERTPELSDSLILLRGDELRSGPVRVAVIANDSKEQAAEAVRAVDRFVKRTFESRTCPAPTPRGPARAGMYSVSLPQGGRAVGLIAAPFDATGDGAQADAELLAAMLAGPSGLLSKTLGAAEAGESWDARIAMGGAEDGALIVRVESTAARLDARMVQVSALFEQLRGGAIESADLERAKARRDADALAARRTEDARAVALFESPPSGRVHSSTTPSLDRAKGAAAALFAPSQLIVVAGRPRP